MTQPTERRAAQTVGILFGLVWFARFAVGSFFAFSRPRNPVPGLGAVHYDKEVFHVVYLTSAEDILLKT